MATGRRMAGGRRQLGVLARRPSTGALGVLGIPRNSKVYSEKVELQELQELQES